MSKLIEEMLNEKAKEVRVDSIKKIMKKLGMTANKAMDVLDIPESERILYIEKINDK